ncbi:ectonucleotide pyrophosphatase/phosphodiesterase family member 6-like [Centruroides sculpturatus]|uniref:ectonucleotide pyrophosphatase/phosphodiesterase family member 6-like n=2 Tax=Centruroides sculpturatus TaxID=218467 RepID=UPI000C6E0538|nr:ectonucleotide pyrophosphatase/phosphodiesterase family member 6-like [Centruroides sculpturatus]
MTHIYRFGLFFMVLCFGVCYASYSPGKLLVILVDGVRWDYMNDSNLSGFQMIAKNGMKANYVTPIFPTNSYPNWYTIVTGLYAENHGIVQNYMYDKEKDDIFLMALHSNASHAHWWNYAEPLWITAEKNGIKTAMYWWDGCQVVIRGKKPSFCREYENYWIWGKVNKDTKDALFKILDMFQNQDYGLGLVYYEAVDANGHFRGPNSKERKKALQDIDSILLSLQEEINRRNLENEVNLMIVSDHGMMPVNQDIKIIRIESAIKLDDIHLMLDHGPMSMILPKEGKEDKVYNDLKKGNFKGLKVYKKEEMPEIYHYKHRLVFPIVLVAEKGYLIQSLSERMKMKPFSDRIYKGYHGYDPYLYEEMRTILYARGPAFKKGYISPPLQMTDHYNVMCKALGIEALPNNGSLSRIEDMLIPEALNSKRQIKNKTNKKGKNRFSKKRKKTITRFWGGSSSVTYCNWILLFSVILTVLL